MRRPAVPLRSESNGSNFATTYLYRDGLSGCGEAFRTRPARGRCRRIVLRIPVGLSSRSGRGRGSYSPPPGATSRLHHIGHLPQAPESGPVQRQYRGADSNIGRRGGSRRASGGCRNRKRGERGGPARSFPWARAGGLVVSQLRGHAGARKCFSTYAEGRRGRL